MKPSSVSDTLVRDSFNEGRLDQLKITTSTQENIAFKCYLDWSNEKYALPTHPYHFKSLSVAYTPRETHYRPLCGKSLDYASFAFTITKKITGFLGLMMKLIVRNMAHFKLF